MRGRRLWLTVSTHGGKIPVYVVKGDLYAADGETEIEAHYDRAKPEIVVLQMGNIAMMKQNLHHELLHVCFGGVSGHVREGIFKATTARALEVREEDLVCFLEPVQFDLLVRNGWLRYPNPPRVK